MGQVSEKDVKFLIEKSNFLPLDLQMRHNFFRTTNSVAHICHDSREHHVWGTVPNDAVQEDHRVL